MIQLQAPLASDHRSIDPRSLLPTSNTQTSGDSDAGMWDTEVAGAVGALGALGRWGRWGKLAPIDHTNLKLTRRKLHYIEDIGSKITLFMYFVLLAVRFLH